ncbi:flagellar assembly protein FliW [Peptococcaceae bacterium]|nr:flagellar assembly protein FliW [Peptococcaceae bacterium]
MSDNILNFKFGIPGLPKDLKKFQLVAVEKDSPFFLLRSVDELSVCFVLIDPFYFFPDYQVELPDQEQKELELHDFQDAAVFLHTKYEQGFDKCYCEFNGTYSGECEDWMCKTSDTNRQQIPHTSSASA